MIALSMDDIPAACNDAIWLSSSKTRLGAKFKIKDLGDLSQLLGMYITRDKSARTISMDPSKYLRDKHGMTYYKPSSMIMDPCFLHASICLYGFESLNILGSAQAHPTEAHLHAIKKVVRYL
jgi:hypothetical protein